METWVKRWPDEGEDNVCPWCLVDRDITTAGNVSIHRVGSWRYLQSRFIAPDVSHPRVSYITPCVKCVGITFPTATANTSLLYYKIYSYV